jgi:hypothetical protein
MHAFHITLGSGQIICGPLIVSYLVLLDDWKSKNSNVVFELTRPTVFEDIPSFVMVFGDLVIIA